MRKTIAVAAGALLAVAGFVTLTGFGGCGGHGRGHPRDPAEVAAFVGKHVDDALDDLNATPDQRSRINAIKDRLLAAAQKAHGDRAAVHETLLAEWKSATPDGQKLHALVDERADAMKAFAHQAVDAGVEIHSILTPEQRDRLTRKIERWHR
jgi:periplasmic protein CpxP/Spy